MRVAITKGSLLVPPTYFALQHAMALEDEHEFRVFTMAAHVTDPVVRERIRIDDASRVLPVRTEQLSWRSRERLMPALSRTMRRHITAFRPDVIHQHFANWALPAVGAARDASAPLILTVHGADVHLQLIPLSERSVVGKPVLRWHQGVVRTAFEASDRILAVSRYLADVAVQVGVDARKLHVHYQGVDTDLYRPSASRATASAQGPARVVAVSALSEAKGTRDLIEASVEISRRTPHALILVGDGPLRPVAEAAAAEHPHITVRGMRTRDQVREELADATVFALPARQSGRAREAAGLVTLEAEASGVPVVVYDSGGAGEMLSDGETGVRVPEGDVPALGAAIEQILRLSARERAAMGARARDWVVAQRSLVRSAAELDEHYRAVV